ncbi:putative FBD-associated F-box protein At5g53635 [Camellia sinensis]|uniref:putative FBD-associated F-box protein At5g53635 n=1 Tax=Camellia sinensis TaxID=4442 RepID=UPI001036CFF2|nr:putative FBD-associated F-box protein At5g53635 [Camellia sinensis]
MEPQLKKTNYKFDWLSNLPDNIIYDILSLLHMRDISCVCTLSRRLRQLCFSMPCMNISLESSLNLKTFWGVKPIKEQELDSFTRFVERFLHLCNGADLFRLRIVAWIYNATMCRVQELDLDIALKNTFCLPLCALNCSSFRVLKLNLNWGKLKLPNVEFNSLQQLSLMKFRVVNPLLGE